MSLEAEIEQLQASLRFAREGSVQLRARSMEGPLAGGSHGVTSYNDATSTTHLRDHHDTLPSADGEAFQLSSHFPSAEREAVLRAEVHKEGSTLKAHHITSACLLSSGFPRSTCRI